MIDIKEIKDPNFIKDLNDQQLQELASAVRSYMIDSVAKTGGHLSCNLSVVELTIALHKFFDGLKDRIIFDGGHQVYTHKILTGRASLFDRLRKEDGITGYPNKNESLYDENNVALGLGLGVAYGYACMREVKKTDEEIICVVDEESIHSGTSLEALRQIGSDDKKIIIIFNDDGEYRKRASATRIQKTLHKLRSDKRYLTFKKTVMIDFNNSKIGKSIITRTEVLKDTIKEHISDSEMFKSLFFNYLGPIDGHDFSALAKAITKAKNEKRTTLIHVMTKKGRGYELIENGHKKNKALAVPFNIETGKDLKETPKGYLSAENIVCESLLTIMTKNKKIMAFIGDYDGDEAFRRLYASFPDRVFRCEAQSNAIAMAYACAESSFYPFLLLDSTEIDKTMMPLLRTIIRYQTPAVIGLREASVIPGEGENRQGIFDITMLNDLDGISIVEGRDYKEIKNLFSLGFTLNIPYFIRIPRIDIATSDNSKQALIYGKWNFLRKLEYYEATIIAYGHDLDFILQEIEINDAPYQLVNACFIKPIDTELIDTLLREGKKILVYSFDYEKGGLYTAIKEYIGDGDVLVMATGSRIPLGSTGQIRKAEKMTWKHITEVLERDN